MPMDKCGNNNGNQQHNTSHYVVIKTYYATHDKNNQTATNKSSYPITETRDNWKGRHGNLGAQVMLYNT
jgi:hypothetical protein